MAEAEAKNLRDLSGILRTSFQAIKRDIASHAERLDASDQRDAMLHHHAQELERAIGTFSTDFITTDKLNVLKIQLAEVRDGLKRISAAEKAISELRVIAQEKQAAEQAVAEVRAEFEKKSSQWRANLKALAATADHAFEKINKNLAAVQVSNSRDIDGRITAFRNEFGSRLTQADANAARHAQKTEATILTHQKRAAEEFQRMARKSHINELVHGINAEFNALKDSIAAIGDDIAVLRETVGSLQRRTRDFEHVQAQFATIHSNFEALKGKVVADLHELHDDVSRLGKKVRENIPPKELRSAARLIHLKSKSHPLIRTSNIFISMAVALIMFAAILFFALAPAQRYVTDWVVWPAVVVFIIGLVFRIVHAAKK